MKEHANSIKSTGYRSRRRYALSAVAALLLGSGSFTGYYLWQIHDRTTCIRGYAEGLETIQNKNQSLFLSERKQPTNQMVNESDSEFRQELKDHPIEVIASLEDALQKHLFPLPITQDEIYPYPGLFDGPSNSRYGYCPPGIDCMELPWEIDSKVKKTILTVSKSVGRLVLYPNRSVTYRGGYPVLPYFWGSTFVAWVKDGVGIAVTSCHEIESLAAKADDGNWNLSYDNNLTLGIDFGYTAADYSENHYEVLNLLGCAVDEGADIAFLSFKISAGQAPPAPVMFYSGNYLDLIDQNLLLALVAYADLHHFVDTKTERLYRGFELSEDAQCPGCDKFAMIDFIASIDRCSKSHNLLDVASTTGGESGGVVLDPRDGTVVGMHICCSKYFQFPTGKAPESELPCARVTRTFQNQIVAAAKIQELLQQMVKKQVAAQVKQ